MNVTARAYDGGEARVRCETIVGVAMNRDDSVAQRPEDVRLLMQIFHTQTACPGAATSYVLRRIAYRAGAYAPGIQESLFHELNTSRDGGSIDKVQRWFDGRVSSLHALGYRLQCRRIAAPTVALLDWVKAGKGYRGAMLPADFRRDATSHAVGLTIDRVDPKSDEDLVMIDPWPGPGAKDKSKVPKSLELAHRAYNFHALVFYWVGWS
jgi:hypothetical protein